MKEIWNEQRKDLVPQYIDETYSIHLDTGDHWEGKQLSHEEFKERLDFSFNAFPDMHFEITSTIEEVQHVAITWIMTGTNLGIINNLPARNRKIRTNGMTIYYFNGNLIAGHSQVFDRTAVVKQLGFS